MQTKMGVSLLSLAVLLSGVNVTASQQRAEPKKDGLSTAAKVGIAVGVGAVLYGGYRYFNPSEDSKDKKEVKGKVDAAEAKAEAARAQATKDRAALVKAMIAQLSDANVADLAEPVIAQREAQQDANQEAIDAAREEARKKIEAEMMERVASGLKGRVDAHDKDVKALAAQKAKLRGEDAEGDRKERAARPRVAVRADSESSLKA